MRKDGAPPVAKPPEMPKAAKEVKEIKIPSKQPGYGQKGAVRLTPKFRQFTAMHFANFESLTYIIPWLGRAFYALTNGDPIGIDGNIIRDKSKTDDSAPLSNLMLIILDPITDRLIVVQEGYWIMFNDEDGYSVYTDDQIRTKYDFTDDIVK